MKSKIAFALVFLLLAIAAPYFIKGPDGKPLLSFEQTDGLLSSEDTRQTYYKWQDKSGVWHFGDDIPEGVTAQAVDIDTAANVVQSVKLTGKEGADSTENKTQQEPALTLPGLPMTVNPADIPKLLEDASNVQSLVDQHKKEIDQAR
ncbi:DUF4124 domain-containing protein [Thalassolituus hydrocarboniclasticus]|uniref:DUF4124 domain-containing protein n=1 Tax=Thalassolituus hydrocarboniclasticus TaxID=2742796 RepID=A0ABY6A6Z5_9GAMM|nr:DUF4124 domain-containing protein [Thalassolituus hydrocarboniclasticus]UXD86004.1 DUF4124 domain-containing protein [Thalassolituus hydrocarboniclasticus]